MSSESKDASIVIDLSKSFPFDLDKATVRQEIEIKETCPCGEEITLEVRRFDEMVFAEGKCKKCGLAFFISITLAGKW